MRRLQNEAKKLSMIYNNVKLDSDTLTVIVKDIGIVTIKATPHYPFRKPDIFINSVPYKTFIKCESKRFNDILYNVFKQCCLQCHSFECDSRWYAGITIEMIIEEIRQIKRLKQDIGHYILLESIKERHNMPQEIPIFDFLMQKNSKIESKK